MDYFSTVVCIILIVGWVVIGVQNQTGKRPISKNMATFMCAFLALDALSGLLGYLPKMFG